MEKHGYHPVSCDYYDQLEAATLHQKEVEIEVEIDGQRAWRKGIIGDLFSRDGEEFIRLGSLEVRLDRISGFRELS